MKNSEYFAKSEFSVDSHIGSRKNRNIFSRPPINSFQWEIKGTTNFHSVDLTCVRHLQILQVFYPYCTKIQETIKSFSDFFNIWLTCFVSHCSVPIDTAELTLSHTQLSNRNSVTQTLLLLLQKLFYIL